MQIRSLSLSARIVPTLAGLVLFSFGPFACPVRANEPGGTAPPGSAPKARPATAGIVIQWWEQSDIAEAIDLRPEQLEALNLLWSEALEARSTGHTEQARLFADFTEALRSGAPGRRAVLIDRLAESAAAQARLPAELMDRGIAVLDENQHGLIAEQFPWIFQRSWLGRLTAREQRIQKLGGSLRIQPRRMDNKGEEHE